MKTQKQKFDVVIVGGGPAGIFSALSVAKNFPNYSIAMLEKTHALGRKILVSGGGRCNITNINLAKDPEKYFNKTSQEFFLSVFKQFSYQDIVKYFEFLGIILYEEKKAEKGKVFPITNRADTILEILTQELQLKKVNVFLDTKVESILKNENEFVINISNHKNEDIKNKVFSKNCILATGGKSYPGLGSDGFGYVIAKSLGHKIIKPIPVALPLEAKNVLSHRLQGLKMTAQVKLISEEKLLSSITDELLFTSFGLSGSVIFSISNIASLYINRLNKEVFVSINAIPSLNIKQIESELEKRSKLRNVTVEKLLYGILPNRYSEVITELAGLKDKYLKDLTQEQKNVFLRMLTDFKIKVSSTRSWNEAEFTSGGVDCKEVNKKTLESKIVENLYFCGEIIDVDGIIGGYNLSWAISSGMVAGKLQNEKLK